MGSTIGAKSESLSGVLGKAHLVDRLASEPANRESEIASR